MKKDSFGTKRQVICENVLYKCGVPEGVLASIVIFELEKSPLLSYLPWVNDNVGL